MKKAGMMMGMLLGCSMFIGGCKDTSEKKETVVSTKDVGDGTIMTLSKGDGCWIINFESKQHH